MNFIINLIIDYKKGIELLLRNIRILFMTLYLLL